MAICDISDYRSCIKEFKVIKNILTVVFVNRGQFNVPSDNSF